ncbi:zinc ribbon domain-containing protein [Propionimicrobium lymphophilum]|uniref:zinc ribbon domain-containing protein n=1 Tax=Propionimicrobium lymphophilum TaxID=33012 RepID=UPI00041804A5|nr:C4-type zinc ribbon domain-containing protein [Propionimicrobium lymphophilum]
MQAEPRHQRVLLDLAKLDTEAAQLQHRKRTLPVLKELSELASERKKLLEEVVVADTKASDTKMILDRVDEDLEPAKARLKRNDELAHTNLPHKQIQAILDESEHLKGRIAELEEQHLSAEIDAEEASEKAAALAKQRVDIETKMKELIVERDEQGKQIDADYKANRDERAQTAKAIPEALLNVYNKISQRNIYGAAPYNNGRCGGCGLELDATDKKRAQEASPETVLRCEECSRILVR